MNSEPQRPRLSERWWKRSPPEGLRAGPFAQLQHRTLLSCSGHNPAGGQDQPSADGGRDAPSVFPAGAGQAQTQPRAPRRAPSSLPSGSASSLEGTCWNLSRGQSPAVTLPAAGTLACGIRCQAAGGRWGTRTASAPSEAGRRAGQESQLRCVLPCAALCPLFQAASPA